MAHFRETTLTMTFASNSDKAEGAIKAELEQVYIMASYVDAGRGRLAIVKHLVSAAIDEMEGLVGEPSARHAKPDQPANIVHLAEHSAQQK